MSSETADRVWDALVVGAGPAGCAAAYDLAAAGCQVLLVDRAQFPRPKACAGGLTAKAVRALRYRIDPVVRRWVHSIVLEETADRTVTLGRSGAPVCAMTVREELDAYCLAQTRARGAAFERTGLIAAVETSQDEVVLRVEGRDPLRARFLVGADGVHSRVRALAGEAPWFRTGFALESNVSCGEDEYPLTFDFAPVEHGYGWLFPRDTHVNVGLYVADPGAAKLDRAKLVQYIDHRCGPGRHVSSAVGQFLGLGAAAYIPSPGTRVLLAGDAAGFVDPLTGEGIYGAIRSGQAAAAAIVSALGHESHAPRSRRSRRLPRGLPVEQGFTRAMRSLRSDLAVAEYAALRFYAEPARGFALLRLPWLRRFALHAYSEGASLGTLLRAVRWGSRLRFHA